MVRYAVDLPTTRTRLNGALFLLLFLVLVLVFVLVSVVVFMGIKISKLLLSMSPMHDGGQPGTIGVDDGFFFAQLSNRHGCYLVLMWFRFLYIYIIIETNI